MARNREGIYHYGSLIGERLAKMLFECGYGSRSYPGCLAISRIVREINRENLGEPVTASVFKSWIYGGVKLTLDDAAKVCKALNLDIEELAYGETSNRKTKRKPRSGLLDEVGPVRWARIGVIGGAGG